MIIFLFGENTCRSRRKLTEYKERYRLKYGPAGDFTDRDFEEDSRSDWRSTLNAGGLFSPVKLVIFRRALQILSREEQEKLRDFLNDSEHLTASREVVIIFWEEKAPPKNSSLYKFFLKKARHEEFRMLSGNSLRIEARKAFSAFNPALSLQSQALEKLLAFTENDPEKMENELRKLSSCKESGEITGEDVDKMVSSSLSSSIFETIEAVSSGNKKMALKLLHEQTANKIDPFYILSMYAYQFRNLLRVSEFYWRGISDRFEIARQAGLHPYVIQKVIPQIKNFTPKKLKKMFSALQKIDYEAKTGRVEIRMALDKFIVKT